MINTLFQLLRSGKVTQNSLFPDLADYNRGLPKLTDAECTGCGACTEVCPTNAIELQPNMEGIAIFLDRGKCIACGGCTSICETGTIVEDRSTQVAVRKREDLILSNVTKLKADVSNEPPSPFRHSLHLRVVSTGDSASDLEVGAANNPIFDASRFGVHFVASPRFADGLLVCGPVALAMQEPLRRCYEAMAEPRMVIAVGTDAISGGVHVGSYAQASGVDAVLPTSIYVPGSPPHPWYILHGILLAMGRISLHPSK